MLIAILFVLLAAPIAQAKKLYPPRSPSCSVDPMTVSSTGSTVTVAGKNWKPNSTVNIFFDTARPSQNQPPGTLIKTVLTSPNGSFSTSANTPPTSASKAYVNFVGQTPKNNTIKCSVTLKVVSPASATRPLSVTGGMLLGLGILALSLVLSIAHRRRARLLRG